MSLGGDIRAELLSSEFNIMNGWIFFFQSGKEKGSGGEADKQLEFYRAFAQALLSHCDSFMLSRLFNYLRLKLFWYFS